MKKRRALSNTELDLVSEAGSMLALNNCSESMMSAFGFNRESCLRAHGKVDNLHEAGLPCPALALLWPDVMDTNVTYLDSLIKRAPNSRTRRLAVCMDFTYVPAKAPRGDEIASAEGCDRCTLLYERFAARRNRIPKLPRRSSCRHSRYVQGRKAESQSHAAWLQYSAIKCIHMLTTK